MEKGFKILAFICLLAGIGLVSCEKTYIYLDEEEPEVPIYEEPGPNMVVEFDGSVWVADSNSIEGKYTKYTQGSFSIKANKTKNETYPSIDMCFNTFEVGQHYDYVDQNQNLAFNTGFIDYLYYYDTISWSVNGNPAGDWWAKEVSVIIEEVDLTDMKASFVVEATMFELLSVCETQDGQSYTINPELLPNANTKYMNVHVNNIPFIIETQEGTYK